MKENYLGLAGYRLPTEAEREYACRAGAVTSRYYGEAEELLVRYAWYERNSKDRTWPVGSRKPNDLGLFDMHGNVWNWCQEGFKDYPTPKGGEAVEDVHSDLSVPSGTSRVLRGASFRNPGGIRSATRNRDRPAYRVEDVGFRPARTLPP
jgi:formylglycine-generating enzyme required for sulfatase activity